MMGVFVGMINPENIIWYVTNKGLTRLIVLFTKGVNKINLLMCDRCKKVKPKNQFKIKYDKGVNNFSWCQECCDKLQDPYNLKE